MRRVGSLEKDMNHESWYLWSEVFLGLAAAGAGGMLLRRSVLLMVVCEGVSLACAAALWVAWHLSLMAEPWAPGGCICFGASFFVMGFAAYFEHTNHAEDILVHPEPGERFF